MPLENSIQNAFTELSHRLVPSDEYLAKGKKACNLIFNLLKEKSRFSLDRVNIGGSAGKKTAIFNSDFDCVVFANIDSISEIENVLDDFEDILLLANLPKLSRMWKTRFSIQFSYDEIDMDFLPAINLVTAHDLAPNYDVSSEQAYKVLERLNNNIDEAYHYSSALVESQLVFMRKQSSFVHDLVRLCKLWNKSLLFDGYISGRSTLIELIAVYAGKIEEGRSCFEDRRSLLNGFNTFLKLMENFINVKIEFDFDPLAPQRLIKNFSWLKENVKLKKTTPFVIEPANPFNNLAKNVSAAEIKLFQMYATETLRRLDLYVLSAVVTLIPLDVIFEPQPSIYCFIPAGIKKFLQTVSFMVSTLVNGGPSSATVKIRNEDKYKSREMQVVLKHFLNVFCVVAQGLVSTEYMNQSKHTNEVCTKLQARIVTYIDVGILGLNPRVWNSTTRKHEDQDVTISIPCYMTIDSKEEKFCVLISWSSV